MGFGGNLGDWAKEFADEAKDKASKSLSTGSSGGSNNPSALPPGEEPSALPEGSGGSRSGNSPTFVRRAVKGVRQAFSSLGRAPKPIFIGGKAAFGILGLLLIILAFAMYLLFTGPGDDWAIPDTEYEPDTPAAATPVYEEAQWTMCTDEVQGSVVAAQGELYQCDDTEWVNVDPEDIAMHEFRPVVVRDRDFLDYRDSEGWEWSTIIFVPGDNQRVGSTQEIGRDDDNRLQLRTGVDNEEEVGGYCGSTFYENELSLYPVQGVEEGHIEFEVTMEDYSSDTGSLNPMTFFVEVDGEKVAEQDIEEGSTEIVEAPVSEGEPEVRAGLENFEEGCYEERKATDARFHIEDTPGLSPTPGVLIEVDEFEREFEDTSSPTTVEASAVLENVQDDELTRQVEFVVNDNVVDTEDVTLSEGQARELEFEGPVEEDAGSIELRADGLAFEDIYMIGDVVEVETGTEWIRVFGSAEAPETGMGVEEEVLEVDESENMVTGYIEFGEDAEPVDSYEFDITRDGVESGEYEVVFQTRIGDLVESEERETVFVGDHVDAEVMAEGGPQQADVFVRAEVPHDGYEFVDMNLEQRGFAIEGNATLESDGGSGTGESISVFDTVHEIEAGNYDVEFEVYEGDQLIEEEHTDITVQDSYVGWPTYYDYCIEYMSTPDEYLTADEAIQDCMEPVCRGNQGDAPDAGQYESPSCEAMVSSMCREQGFDYDTEEVWCE